MNYAQLSLKQKREFVHFAVWLLLDCQIDLSLSAMQMLKKLARKGRWIELGGIFVQLHMYSISQAQSQINRILMLMTLHDSSLQSFLKP